MNAAQINTIIGTRERRTIAGTDYGSLEPRDRKTLVKMGYEIRELRKATGIIPNGNLVVRIDSTRYYEIEAPAKRR